VVPGSVVRTVVPGSVVVMRLVCVAVTVTGGKVMVVSEPEMDVVMGGGVNVEVVTSVVTLTVVSVIIVVNVVL
jgi:hypothetical protein